ncbi:hypothetical protein JCM10908_002357 [Rhodotorula pacifica]|uniref:uncharacterized protein n=1 Tax=Rhodotorula pacifica TaxID=1495444 RepID=UPI0031780F4C
MATTSQTTQDIQAARRQASFGPDALNRVLSAGSRDQTLRRRVVDVLSKDARFDKTPKAYLSRAQTLERAHRLTRDLFAVVDENGWNAEEYGAALSLIDEPIGLNLHEIAFTPVIQSQGSDEQQKEWLPKCYSHEILGCYLQTELGHGSNVQQLETTATYDPKEDAFVIHSGPISATKWWIGALGLMSTHGVVQARLILNGQDKGPHLFIIQLRSLEDHALLPGIEAGEIGPKVHGAMAGVDNGFARFNHVRVPRKNMLSRFAKVEPSQDGGKYIQAPHSKLSYGGMVYIRAQMIGSLAWQLARAATIATRYLHMRRQFADADAGGPREQQVIKYPSVYMRVVPQIVNAYVFISAGKEMASLYRTMSTQLASGDTTLLAETHAISSGLKVYVSSNVVEGAETLRRAMGGHGFLASTGIGRIYATELPSTTYEGDNFILNLQVARSALKAFTSLVTAKAPKEALAGLTPSSAYLSSLVPAPKLPIAAPSSVEAWQDHSTLLRLLSLRAALSVARIARMIQHGKKFGELSWECVALSEAVVEAFLGKVMVETLAEGGSLTRDAGSNERKVLRQVVTFFLLHRVQKAAPALLELGILAAPPPPSLAPPSSKGNSKSDAPSPLELLREALDKQARSLLPELVGLTDAFGFSDWELDSVVAHDGAVYERMLEKAKADEKLNAGDKADQKRLYTEYIKPVLRRGQRINAKQDKTSSRL